LYLLKDLGFRSEAIAAGISTFEPALARVINRKSSGSHVRCFCSVECAIDTGDRARPSFPNDKVDIATEKITEVLAALGASEMISP